MAAEIRTGTYTGTGAAVNIELGWTPDYVKVVNVTDGDEYWEWFAGMTAAHAIYTRSVTDNATTGNAGITRITSNGISQRSPTDYASKQGFTAGSALSESGDTFAYIAVRNGDY